MSTPIRSGRPSPFPLALAAFACVAALSLPAAAEDARVAKLAKENAAEYAKLGDWCRGQGLPAEAAAAFRDALRLDPGNEKAKAGLEAKPAARAKDFAKARAAFEPKLRKLEDDFLGKYVAAGKALLKEKKAEAASEAFRRALEIDGKSEEVHKARNEVLLKDAGWVPKEVAEKVGKGLREFQGAWKAKEEVEALRARWENAWEIETDHYAVRANLPWEEAQALAGAVEEVYGAFFHVFGRAWGLAAPPENMKVHCFRTREEFQEGVRAVEPRAVGSPGFYNSGTRTAYFFKREGYLTTVLHECAHQLLDCMAGQDAGLTGKAQFWAIEGVPSLFETLEWSGRRPHFFRKTTPKLEILRKGLGVGGQPLKEFAALTQGDFMQSQERYAQALGLAHFLLNGEGGKYRERFLVFFREVVQGRGTPGLLEEAFREDLGEIEKGWLLFASGAGD